MPFPYVEKNRLELRPALVISTLLGPERDLFWALMITSARRSAWPGDVDLTSRHGECGLQVPCLVRTEKVSVLRTESIEGVIGRLPSDLMQVVQKRVEVQLALALW